MTHSYRHTPIKGVTSAKSEKKYKVLLNRIVRHVNKSILKNGEYAPYIIKNDVLTTWDMPKDGKIYSKDKKILRK